MARIIFIVLLLFVGFLYIGENSFNATVNQDAKGATDINSNLANTPSPTEKSNTNNINTTATTSSPLNTSESDEKFYSLNEISKHTKSNDCWMAIDGKVYDVSSFVSQHPGGFVILEGCGTDATFLFDSQREHKSEARGMLSDYYIGELE